ncbi:hypothetical protein EBH_0075370 [Eimeria brunetti]|uniref:Reverse transcriptase, related n=1 Tax=Eimeria brunetti TaxID=51314 RepID=U6LJ45_9EIME|nr:hypothetical protein EBH_0075370 [Eimeria brunetti]
MCAVATGPDSIPVSPDWGKKLLGRAVQETAEGRDVGENQRPLVVQPHAATTVQNEEGITRNQDQGTRLTVGPVPYDLVVGLDWLTQHRVAWYFQSDKLRTYVNGQWCDLPVVRAKDVNQPNGGTQGVRQRTPAEQAYEALARQIAGMTKEEATALLRPPPKRYKTPTKGKRKAVVATLIQQAMESATCIRHPFQGLYAMLALPAVETNVALQLVEERQGALCCVLVETSHSNPQEQCITASPASALSDEEETSPWSTSKLEYSQFDAWLTSGEAQATPRPILDVKTVNLQAA